MKKVFLTLATYLVAKEMSQEAFDLLDATEHAKVAKEIGENNIAYAKQQETAGADAAELAKIANDIAAETKTQVTLLMKSIAVMQDKMIDMGKGSAGAEVVGTIKSIVSENFAIIKGMAANSDDEFTIKADTNTASVANNTGSFRDNNISPLNTPHLTMETLFPHLPLTGNKDNVNKSYTYMDWDTATTVRAAAMVAECAAFPESTAKWEEKSIKIKKVGDSIPVCDEFFEDEAMFAAELEFFLRDNVAIEVNTQIATGDNLGENLKGLITSATTFIPVASAIPDPSIYDLLAKVKASITALGKKFTPDFAVMNNTDICLMKLKKDANNNYIMPPFVDRGGNVVDGMVIIEDNSIAANTLVVGDRKFGKIIDRVGVTVARGYVDDQFLKDQTTLKIRRRLAFLIKDSDAAGFSHVTSISAALATLAL